MLTEISAGDSEGPLIVLLHGFPEFWYGWRSQIRPLAASGFRVIAPDMRGYNLSSRPEKVEDYDIGKLTADVRDLIHERGARSASLVGHDWGGSVAWATAMNHPEVVQRLAILNAAHPRKLSQGLHHPGQLRRSWYFFFDLPDLPETVVRSNEWHFFRHFLRDAEPPYTPHDIEQLPRALIEIAAPSERQTVPERSRPRWCCARRAQLPWIVLTMCAAHRGPTAATAEHGEQKGSSGPR